MSKEKYHYHILFKANHSNGRVSEHTRYVDLESPIEFASDIQLVEEWAAGLVGAVSVMLCNWTALEGNIRPYRTFK